MRFILIITLGSLFFLFGCFTYEVQYDGPPEEEDVINELPKSLVYVSGGRVFLSNHYGLDSLIINTGSSVEIASINNDHTKVLFKEAGEEIQEYDIALGTISRFIPGSADAIFFDYHPNGQLIFHFTLGGLLSIEGGDLYPNNPLDLKQFFPASSGFRRVHGATILPNNEIVMSIYWEGFGVNYDIIRTDGTNVLDSRPKNTTYEQFRVNPSGTELLASDNFGLEPRLNDINIFNLAHNNFSGSILGTPNSYISEDFGYLVSDDFLNEIFIPNNSVIVPVFGNVTSIDY